MALKIARSKAAWALLLALTAFYILGARYLPRTLFLELLRAMLGVVALVVSAAYMIDIPQTYRRENEGVLLMRSGITLAWSVIWIQSFLRIYYFEFFNQAAGPVVDAFAGFPMFVSIIAASFHLTAIGINQYGFARLQKNLFVVAGCLISGLAIVGFFRLLKLWK